MAILHLSNLNVKSLASKFDRTHLFNFQICCIFDTKFSLEVNIIYLLNKRKTFLEAFFLYQRTNLSFGATTIKTASR